MFARFRLLLELIRFSHTVFALPFALTSAALAWRDKWRDEPFSYREFGLDLLGILTCMVFARSTAMAFNRIADRRYDAANPRTATRHLPAGQISLATVWLFTLVCAGGFVASTILFLASSGNSWPPALSVPTLLFICAYSLTKRFTMPWSERQNLQFRWEAYNVTNTVLMDPNSASVSLTSTSTFGRLSTQLGAPRQMEFALRYNF